MALSPYSGSIAARPRVRVGGMRGKTEDTAAFRSRMDSQQPTPGTTVNNRQPGPQPSTPQAANPLPNRRDNILAARADGTFDAKRAAYNQQGQATGHSMDEAGNITAPPPRSPASTPAPAPRAPISPSAPPSGGTHTLSAPATAPTAIKPLPLPGAPAGQTAPPPITAATGLPGAAPIPALQSNQEITAARMAKGRARAEAERPPIPGQSGQPSQPTPLRNDMTPVEQLRNDHRHARQAITDLATQRRAQIQSAIAATQGPAAAARSARSKEQQTILAKRPLVENLPTSPPSGATDPRVAAAFEQAAKEQAAPPPPSPSPVAATPPAQTAQKPIAGKTQVLNATKAAAKTLPHTLALPGQALTTPLTVASQLAAQPAVQNAGAAMLHGTLTAPAQIGAAPLQIAQTTGEGMGTLVGKAARAAKNWWDTGETEPKKGIAARADGGPVQAHRPYLVGERGPEIIVPKHSGTVIPNHQITDLTTGPETSNRPLDPKSPVLPAGTPTVQRRPLAIRPDWRSKSQPRPVAFRAKPFHNPSLLVSS